MSDDTNELQAIGASQRQSGMKAVSWTLVPILGSIVLGLGALCFYSVGVAGFFWSLACLAVGSLFGIVFGIPREASRPSQNESPQSTSGLRASTNMEEISDWLTKLLVGVGLVELKNVASGLERAARFVSASLPPASRSEMALESVAASIIVYFTVEGFIGGYLITRVFFQIAFQRSDQAIRRDLGSGI